MQIFKESLNLNENSLCTDALSPSKKRNKAITEIKETGLRG